MMGKPVITGTRITVESILDRFAAGETIDQMLEAHPRLTKEAIFAVSEQDQPRNSNRDSSLRSE
jgi:uncharacterized protein (DUF433 family)